MEGVKLEDVFISARKLLNLHEGAGVTLTVSDTGDSANEIDITISSSTGGGIDAVFSKTSTLSTGTGTFRWYNDTGVSLTIAEVRASVGTAPTGQAILIDVNVDGTTIFAGGTDRPEIADGANTDTTTGMSTTTIADGSYFTVDIDQIGSGTAGADLTVQIRMSA